MVYPKSIRNYLDVGHSYNYDNYEDDEVFDEDKEESPILWVFYEGKILSIKDSEVGGGGHSVWQHQLDSFSSDGNFRFKDRYCGRYDPNTGDLSLVVPVKYKLRKLPNVLIKSLNVKFNPQKIHVF